MADLPEPISRQDELLHNIADGTPNIDDLIPISRQEEYLKYIALNGGSGGGGSSDINVVQTTGDSTTSVMSQKAVTDELQALTPLNKVTFEPTLTVPKSTSSATRIPPTYTTNYNESFYVKMGIMCYISVYLDVNVTDIGSGVARIGNLPFNSIVSGGSTYQALSKGAIDGIDVDTVLILDNSSSVELRNNNGIGRIPWITGNLLINFSGWYLTNET